MEVLPTKTPSLRSTDLRACRRDTRTSPWGLSLVLFRVLLDRACSITDQSLKIAFGPVFQEIVMSAPEPVKGKPVTFALSRYAMSGQVVWLGLPEFLNIAIAFIVYGAGTAVNVTLAAPAEPVVTVFEVRI